MINFAVFWRFKMERAFAIRTQIDEFWKFRSLKLRKKVGQKVEFFGKKSRNREPTRSIMEPRGSAILRILDG